MTPETLNIPKILIYEEDEGKPIYYKGYKKVLSGELNIEFIMGSSLYQSHIISRIFLFLGKHLDENEYELLVSELGLQLAPNNTRASDIAIYKKEIIRNFLTDKKYSSLPPEIIFEIDIKADLEESGSQGYVNIKTQQLLDWGVKKIIWIETASRKVIIATPDAPWLIINWTTDIEIIDNLKLNLAQLLD